MKVYVDELPKSCCECICWDENWGCNIGDFNKKTCSLQSLADYTKQVRKEVVQEIRKLIKDNSFLANEMLTGERLECLSKYKMLDILLVVEDQIQGEGNVEN